MQPPLIIAKQSSKDSDFGNYDLTRPQIFRRYPGSASSHITVFSGMEVQTLKK
jgi:hypothetical protein